LRNYLSFGAGVNSVALYLLMVELGIEFEAVFSDTGCEWPETYHYLAMFQWWTKANGLRSVTILKPDVEKIGPSRLIEYCEKYKITPGFKNRFCTDKWKVRPLHAYFKRPAFINIGFAMDEAKRAKLASDKDFENRFLLIEHEITRSGCIEIIRKAGLPIPRKSGCYICPNQRPGQWKELRRYHPELFCRAVNLEKRQMEYRIERGKSPCFLSNYKKMTLPEIVGERQEQLFKEDEYPPCLCGL
jgi:hypothetical protein